MKLTTWCFAAVAPIVAAGWSGTMLGHVAVLALTVGLFVGTLSLGRSSAGHAKAHSGPAPDAVVEIQNA